MAAFQEAMRSYAKKPVRTISLVGKKETPQRAGRRIISLAKVRKTPPAGAINFLKSISPDSSQSTPGSLRSLHTPVSLRSLASTPGSIRTLSTPRRSRNGRSPANQSPQNYTPGPGGPGDLQTPIASIKYQNCSTAVRRELDSILQRLARDPNSRTTVSKSEAEKEGNKDRGNVQYFDSFCIDRFGIRDMPAGTNNPAELEAFHVPNYQGVINVVALPIQCNQRSGKKDIRSTLGVCFNCGTSGHSARECTKKIDTKAIRENGRLFREFGNSGKKKNFKQRYRGRYYDEEVLRTEVGLKAAPPRPSRGRGRGRGSGRGRGRGSRGRGRGSGRMMESPRSSHSQENPEINTITSGIQVVEDASNHKFPVKKKIVTHDDFYGDFSSGGGSRVRRGRGRGSGRGRGRGYSPYGRGRGSRGSRGSRGRGRQWRQ